MQNKNQTETKKTTNCQALSASQSDSFANRVFNNPSLHLSPCLSESQWQYLSRDI